MDTALKLVSAFSRALRPSERNYSATQFECLALVETMKFNDAYLSKARGITVLVDHKPLTYLVKLRDHQTGMLARWAIWLSGYDIKVVYKAGKEHVVPDALSRAPLPDGAPVWSGRRLAEITLLSPDTDEIQVAALESSQEVYCGEVTEQF